MYLFVILTLEEEEFCFVGVPSLITPLYHTPHCTPLIPKIPQTSFTQISVAQSLVSTDIYLCSLTFSLRPDEVASVWRQQNLVFKNVIYCFVSAP